MIPLIYIKKCEEVRRKVLQGFPWDGKFVLAGLTPNSLYFCPDLLDHGAVDHPIPFSPRPGSILAR
jgi:hypothetical protein